MFNAIRKLFSPPIFEDEDESRRASILNIILWATFFLLFFVRAISVSGDENWGQRLANPISVLILVIVILIGVMKRGYIRQVSLILLIAAWAALSFQAYNYSGIYDVAYIGTIILILLAGLLLDFRYTALFAILSILTGWGLAYSQTVRSSPIEFDQPYIFARDYSVVFTLITLISYLIISGLRNAVTIARENEQKQIKTNRELLQLQTSLEERVAARTQELQETSAQLVKRAEELEAVAEISRALASIQNIDELLPAIVNSINERLGYYHAGIYLLNEARDYVVLNAASSAGGQLLLKNQHRLRVEPDSLVGFAASRGKARVVRGVELDATFRAVPELPETKSEAALPLMAGTQLIGVLDVQSTQPDAFSDPDINILNTLGSQIAISIQNARSFDETHRALAEAENIYQQFVQQGWKRISREQPNLGYKFSQAGLTPLKVRGESLKLESTASTTSQEDQANLLSVPIKLRGQTIGMMRVRPTKLSRKWDEGEMAMIQATVERAALALETARLLEDSQHRAAKERLIGEISSKISASVDLDNILQTAAKELGLAISDSEVVVRFQTPESEQQKEQDHVE